MMIYNTFNSFLSVKIVLFINIAIKRICKETSESMEINKLSESFPSISNNQKSQSKLNSKFE